MPDIFVANHFLKLRPQPNTSQPEIAQLHAGQKLAFQATNETSTWSRVKCKVDGQDLEGWVSNMYTRNSLGAEVDRLAESAGIEYRRFKWGALTDADKVGDACPLIEDYWQLFPGHPHDCHTPWSAVFISFVIKRANLAKKFKGGTAHVQYMRQAKKDREAADSTKAYWAFRLNEKKAEVGDIIGAWRQGPGCATGPFTYDDLHKDFCSHCDLVVSIRGGKATALGGNISNTVKETEYELDANGFVQEIKKRIVILKRQA